METDFNAAISLQRDVSRLHICPPLAPEEGAQNTAILLFVPTSDMLAIRESNDPKDDLLKLAQESDNDRADCQMTNLREVLASKLEAIGKDMPKANNWPLNKADRLRESTGRVTRGELTEVILGVETLQAASRTQLRELDSSTELDTSVELANA